MTQATPADYWLSRSGLYIQLNAAGEVNYIHANCTSGSAVICYMRGVDGLGYDVGHNYRRWPLVAAPTVFHDDSARYVYIAIPKSQKADAVAQVVFPSEMIDIYGKNEAGTQIGGTDYFYIFIGGIISSVQSATESTPRGRKWDVPIVYGTLASDEAISAVGGSGDWWTRVGDFIEFIKDITKATIQNLTATFASITQLVLNGKPLNSVATDEGGNPTSENATDAVVTPAYGKARYLSRVNPDTALGRIDFLKGAQFGEFNGGLVGGTGGAIDERGAAELKSLVLREFLETPELRYNRVEVFVGNNWRAPGGGVIERVEYIEGATTGILYLKLEDGEIGKIAQNDFCMGIFHDLKGVWNDNEDFDNNVGEFKFAGFYTTYFQITGVQNADESINAMATYSLKPGTYKHPEMGMHFVCFGNSEDPDRQSSRYSTLTYERYLRNVNDWTWGKNNIAAQFGDLSNLSAFGLDMAGYSAYLNNIYFTGKIQQLDNIIEQFEDMQGYYVDMSSYADDVEVGYDGYCHLFTEQEDGTRLYKIHSAINVRRENELLAIAETAGKGTYSLSIQPNGCEAILENSTVYITRIGGLHDGYSDEEYNEEAMKAVRSCSVNILVDCEGRTVITRTMNVGVKHRGDKGADGKSPAAVMRGPYDNSAVYVGNEYRLDCVYIEANGTKTYFLAKMDAGEFSGIAPGGEDNLKWREFGANFETVATWLLLAENANVAGWIFRNGRMESQTMREDGVTPKTFLDGITGFIDAISGSFEGVIKAALFYGSVKTLSIPTTTDLEYELNPEIDRANTYVFKAPENSKFAYLSLPSSNQWDGLELCVLIKSEGPVALSPVYIKAPDDTLNVRNSGYNITSEVGRSLYVDDLKVGYSVDISHSYWNLLSNHVYRFKSMGGEWYCIDGIVTGD